MGRPPFTDLLQWEVTTDTQSSIRQLIGRLCDDEAPALCSSALRASLHCAHSLTNHPCTCSFSLGTPPCSQRKEMIMEACWLVPATTLPDCDVLPSEPSSPAFSTTSTASAPSHPRVTSSLVTSPSGLDRVMRGHPPRPSATKGAVRGLTPSGSLPLHMPASQGSRRKGSRGHSTGTPEPSGSAQAISGAADAIAPQGVGRGSKPATPTDARTTSAVAAQPIPTAALAYTRTAAAALQAQASAAAKPPEVSPFY